MENNELTYGVQEPFVSAEFAENPDPRCPCLLLLDTSGSMSGAPIRALNEGLQQFRNELLADSLSTKRVEVAMVTFGPVNIAMDFTSAENFLPPDLVAGGDTPMGAAITEGLQILQARKEVLRSHGIKLFRPWIFLITDGAPTDDWSHAPELIRSGEQDNKFSFFSLAVQNADIETLRQICVREPIPLKGISFREFFKWLSASLRLVSQSNPGDKIALPDRQPYGWAEV